MFFVFFCGCLSTHQKRPHLTDPLFFLFFLAHRELFYSSLFLCARNIVHTRTSTTTLQHPQAYIPTVFDGGLSNQGDPVCDMWFVSGRLAACLEKHGATRVMAYTVNWFVCRQLQLDHLSRSQQRYVRLLFLFHSPHGGLWRLVTNGPTRDYWRYKKNKSKNGKVSFSISSTVCLNSHFDWHYEFSIVTLPVLPPIEQY